MRTLIILLSIILLASCGGKKAVPGINRTVKDSVHVTERVEITYDTITIPEDSATIKALLRTLNEQPQVIKSDHGRASVSLSRKRDTIIAVANCALEDRIFALENKITELTRTKQKKEIVTLPPEEVPYVPFWVKVLAWAGGISLGLMGLSAAIKKFNPFSFITNR